jgi:hypothetical protein
MPTDQFDPLTGHAARHDAIDAALAAPTFVSATAPVDPAEGATWLDTSGTPVLKVWVDGSPGEWVEIAGGGGGGGDAEDIAYDNTTSGLAATDVQEALDEIAGDVAAITPGLVNFTESVDTSAPNDTVPAVSFTATDAATNVDAVFASKGTGARLAQVPDNTTTGGNKRGANALDFQVSRTANTQVALGPRSTICNGQNNTITAGGSQGFIGGGTSNSISGANASVVGGNTNTASGSQSGVLSGNSNTASGSDSAVVCGVSNQATASRAFVGGGVENQATGVSSWIPGGVQASTRGLFSAWAWSGARRATSFDNQVIGITAQGSTINDTPLVLTADRGSASATNILVMPNNSCWTGEVCVRGRSGANVVHTEITLVMSRGANAASTVVDYQNPVETFTAAGLAGVAITIVADTTRGGPVVQVTGLLATTIDWFAIFHGGQIVR